MWNSVISLIAPSATNGETTMDISNAAIITVVNLQCPGFIEADKQKV